VARPITTVLEAVRVSEGITQAELGTLSQRSQTLISNVEAGLVDLSGEHSAAFAKALNMPAQLLQQDLRPTRILHRTLPSMPAKARAWLDAELALTQLRVGRLLGDAPADIPRHPVSSGLTLPSDAARTVRRAWGVSHGPVPDVMRLVEDHGITCLIRDLSRVRLTAIGDWSPDSPPVLLTDTGAAPRDQRFAMAHELGHAVMHDSPSREAEADADKFAMELLLPRADIRGLLTGVRLWHLSDLEEQWGVSATVLTRRALDIGAITKTHFIKLRREILDPGTGSERASREHPTLIATELARRVAAGHTYEQLAAGAFLDRRRLQRDYLRGAARRTDSPRGGLKPLRPRRGFFDS
jgi:Zn-dependent peptidase ImmA (M78 family)/transcriptional regulator with XRE-family HTH domain